MLYFKSLNKLLLVFLKYEEKILLSIFFKLDYRIKNNFKLFFSD